MSRNRTWSENETGEEAAKQEDGRPMSGVLGTVSMSATILSTEPTCEKIKEGGGKNPGSNEQIWILWVRLPICPCSPPDIVKVLFLLM